MLLYIVINKIIPNITIMAPKDFKELEQMLEFAVELEKPVIIRYPRGGEDKTAFEKHEEIELGKAELSKEGKDITIIGIGKTVSSAIKLAKGMKEEQIYAEVINARFLKPFDKEKIIKSIVKTKKVITMEDNTIVGGLGSEVKELIASNNDLQDIEIKTYGIEDKFMGFATWDNIFKKIEEQEKSNKVLAN